MQIRNNEQNDLEKISNLIKTNKFEELKALLEQQKTMLSGHRWWNYHTRDDLIENATFEAIMAGHENVVRLLMDAGLPPDVRTYENDYGMQPLIHYAVKSGKLSMVKLMVESGAKIYSSKGDKRGKSYGLKTAVMDGRPDIVKYLLECGADANGTCDARLTLFDEGSITFLAKAAENGNIRIVELLIEYGADVPSTLNLAYKKMYVGKYKKYLSSIEYADTHEKKQALQKKADDVRNRYARIVKTCMDYATGCHFDKNGTSFLGDLDISGMNFMGVSVTGQHVVTREYLEKEAKSGADHAIITRADLTSLEEGGRKTALSHRLNLLQAKRGILESKEGIINLIPLYVAAAMNDIAAVKARLDAGEDPNLEEVSPLILAAQYGNEEVVKMLYEAHIEHTKNKTKQLVLKAEELLSVLEVKALSVEKGEVQNVSLPFASNLCLIIIPGQKKLTSLMEMNKAHGSAVSENIQEIVSESQTQNKNFVGIVKKDGTIEYVQYDDMFGNEKVCKLIMSLIKSAYTEDHCFPAIVTNKHNFDVVQALIVMQYLEIDKSKSMFVNAIEAARRFGHSEIVEFLQEHQDINQQDEEGYALLHKAIVHGDVSRVRELIGKGANVNLETNKGATPLAMATKYSGDAKSHWRNKDEISGNHTEIVRLLLENGADPNENRYCMTLAVGAGNAKVLAMLLPVTEKKDLHKKIRSSNDEDESEVFQSYPWYTDMMFEALDKDDVISLLTLLKEYNADFNVKDEHGSTLLHELVCDSLPFHTKVKVLDYLFEHGADPRLLDQHGDTPLFLLIKERDLSRLKEADAALLLDGFFQHGADINAVDKKGLTLLHHAAKKNDVVTMKYLLNHGVNMDSRAKDMRTPLHCAAGSGSNDAVQLLLERKADYTLVEEKGLTPLECSDKTATKSVIAEYIAKCESEAKKKNSICLPLVKIVAECLGLYRTRKPSRAPENINSVNAENTKQKKIS